MHARGATFAAVAALPATELLLAGVALGRAARDERRVARLARIDQATMVVTAFADGEAFAQLARDVVEGPLHARPTLALPPALEALEAALRAAPTPRAAT
jgi:hypothetical protein